MEKPLIRIHNTQTNEIIDREMTDLEYKEFLEDKKQLDKLQKPVSGLATTSFAHRPRWAD